MNEKVTGNDVKGAATGRSGRSAALERLSALIPQISFAECDLDAIDRSLGIGSGDVLVCEATCLSYVEHALADHSGLDEVWIASPAQFYGGTAEGERSDLDELFGSHAIFKGVAYETPTKPFKLLITTQYPGVPIEEATRWPLYNQLWVDMLNTRGSAGVAVYPSIGEQEEGKPSLRDGNLNPGHFVRSTELSNGLIALGSGEPGETFLMEDLTDTGNPWAREATALELAANDGCLVPSMYRSGIEVLEETTIGALSSRVGRGTSLSEKDLIVKERLDARVVEPRASAPGRRRRRLPGGFGGAYTPKDRWFEAREEDLYYVDGSCFNNGEIWPNVIESIPEGQERYVVDQYDGEVLLVSRNSRQVAIYKAVHPTLISNNVFVICPRRDISRSYLACWLRGAFARMWLYNEGKLLSKGVLSGLPVPILDDETMELVVRHERAIDEKIFDLREEIGKLEHSNRFAPSAATREHKDE